MSKSTGPKTPHGKAASSRNAIRHGLTASQLLLPGEDAAAYESLHLSLTQSHSPAAGLETILVDQIAQCVWRLNRARRIERDILDRDLIAVGGELGPQLDKILRYVTAIEREFHRAVRELTALQAARVRNHAAERKAQASREIALMEAQLRDRVLSKIPENPFPLTTEEVARLVNDPNYETNPFPPPVAAAPPVIDGHARK
jgi:hypothetical protein